MLSTVLIAHNLRSSHNVGSLLRTADCLGVNKVYLTGYTPFPNLGGEDDRLPHIARKVHRQIDKTALGAQDLIDWEQSDDINEVIGSLKKSGFEVFALEQTKKSKDIVNFNPPDRIALVVGREVEGLEDEVLDMCDEAVEIPMRGKKESLNVSQAAAIGLYHVIYYEQITG